jgi:hypothetical protein
MLKTSVAAVLVIGLLLILGSLAVMAQCNPQPWCEYMSCWSDGGVCNYNRFVECMIFYGVWGIARPVDWSYYCPPPQGPGWVVEWYGEICTPCVPM